MELRDKLEEEGKLDDDEIDEECEKTRTKMVQELERGGKDRRGGKGGEKEKGGAKMKSYQVHELAEAKARESEKLRRALGLKGDLGDEKDGEGEHPMARQERRKREAELQRMKMEEKSEDLQNGRERRPDEDYD